MQLQHRTCDWERKYVISPEPEHRFTSPSFAEDGDGMLMELLRIVLARHAACRVEETGHAADLSGIGSPSLPQQQHAQVSRSCKNVLFGSWPI